MFHSNETLRFLEECSRFVLASAYSTLFRLFAEGYFIGVSCFVRSHLKIAPEPFSNLSPKTVLSLGITGG